MQEPTHGHKTSDFFYLTLALIGLLWGYVNIPTDQNAMNLKMLRYLHITKLNKALSDHYYLVAETYLYELNNETSTQALVQAIELDPYPFSARYRAYRKLREDFLQNEEKKNRFY